MLNLFTNVAKAGVAVALSPVAVVADVVRMPFEGKPFELTETLLKNAAKSINEATK